jgi:hypothetical protein
MHSNVMTPYLGTKDAAAYRGIREDASGGWPARQLP